MENQSFFDKFVELMGKFAEIRAVAALRDGAILTTPFTVGGSAFLLFACLPIPGWTEFMASIFGGDWQAPFWCITGGTFDILGLVMVLGITYKYCEGEGCDPMMGALLALSSFAIIVPSSVTLKSGEVAGGVIPKLWTGGSGMITAIIVSFVVSYIFCYCIKNHVCIKMPDSVPGGVVRAFEALVPGVILMTIFGALAGACHYMGNTTVPELIFKVIQVPLQGLTDTLLAGSIIAALQSILFWAGIHGPNVVGGVVGSILQANSLDNQAILNAGGTLIGNPQAHIITQQVNDVFIKLGGCGLTIGFLIASWMSAKSQQMKTITKLATVPGCFNINEPIIFGLPIVFNPYMLVPFVVVPLLALVITYASIAMGFMAPFSAVQAPWTAPPIISGLLLNGWQGAVVQLVIVAMSTAIYFPFVRVQDNAMLKEEQAGENN